jgi:segregation and condensation protein B
MQQPPLIDIPPTPRPSAVQLIESLLFIAGEPVAVADLARALEIPPDAVEVGLEELARSCAGREAAAAVERFLGVQGQPRISGAALEVLAIIAYRQPVTRAQIEAIRGVDSGGVIRALLGRELIGEAGRLETVGRPILYATTPEFLRQFGLGSLAELPPLDLFGVVAEAPANDDRSSPEVA